MYDGHLVFGSSRYLYYFLLIREAGFSFGELSLSHRTLSHNLGISVTEEKDQGTQARRLRSMARLWPSVTLGKSVNLQESLFFHF